MHSLVTEFSKDSNVRKVTVNSTLNKKYTRDSIDHNVSEIGRVDSSDRHRPSVTEGVGIFDEKTSKSGNDELEYSQKLLISGETRGKALIICNQHEFKPGMTAKELATVASRKKALKTCETVFNQYFGFEVLLKKLKHISSIWKFFLVCLMFNSLSF